MKLLSLPPYAPELNPVEHLWDELREKHFHNKAFDSMDALEDQLDLLAASFRFHLMINTLAVQLTLPSGGCVQDVHLQVVFSATTAVPTAPVKA